MQGKGALVRLRRKSRALAVFLVLAVHAAAAAPKTKLVVAIIVDQFRYDYMTRFDADYHEGLRYPHLERLANRPARLDDILTPKS